MVNQRAVGEHLPDGRPVRICYVLNLFPAVSETFISEEAAEMIRLGVDVSILSLNKGDFAALHPSTRMLIKEGLVDYLDIHARSDVVAALVFLLVRRPLATLATLAKAFRAYDRWRYIQALPVARQILSGRVQYLHAHFADANLKFAAILSAWTGIPFGFTVHGYDLRGNLIGRSEFLSLADRASVVVTVSENFKRRILDKYPMPDAKILVNHNGINLEKFVSVKPVSRSKELRIITVGRLVRIKGHDTLLNAFKEIHDQGYPARLTVVGDGELRMELEETVRAAGLGSFVRFEGSRSQDELIALLDESDVFVMPSHDESFGVACVEAMAMERPVVASRVGGLPEIVEEGETGLLIDPKNVTQLTQALLYILENPSRRIEMGKKGRELVVKRFSLSDVSARLLQHVKTNVLEV